MNFHGGDIYSLEKTVLDFSSNINPLGVPESFRKVLAQRINDFTRYPDIQYRELRSVLAGYLGFDRPDLLIPGNGAVEIIFKTIAALNCSRIVTFSPTFSEYARAARQQQKEVIDFFGYDEEFTRLNLDLLIEKVPAGSLVVICNPNNPTGTFLEPELISQAAEKLREKECFLLLDEAFIEFTDQYPQNSMVKRLAGAPNLIAVRAATKFFGMPGIRLGFCVTSNEKLAGRIKDLMEPWNVNTAAVLAGCTVYRDRDYINASQRWITEERNYLYQQLREIAGLTVYPSKANYHLVRIDRSGIDAWRLKDLLIEKGILIRTPDGFNYLSSSHVRLAVKDRHANKELVKSLREILS